MRRYHLTLRRKAVAGIVAAVIMFAMLFTVGTAYFLFVNSTNLQYVQSLLTRTNNLQDRAAESMLLSVALSGSGHITFVSNNTSPISLNITAAIVTDTFGNMLQCDGRGLPGTCGNSSPALPMAMNPARGSGVVDTGYTYVGAATVIVKVITSRGNVFSATYPASSTVLAAQALSSGAIGDVYLKPGSFSYYSIVACGLNSCLQRQGLGFSIQGTFATSNQMAFSVTVTNLNPNQLNLTLDANTLLADFFTPRGTASNAKNIAWFIISNLTTVIQPTYTPITLLYNKPYTLVFGSSTSGTFTGFTVSTAQMPTPNISLVFILTHGCKAMKAANCNTNTYNYAQNSPYVATLYY